MVYDKVPPPPPTQNDAPFSPNRTERAGDRVSQVFEKAPPPPNVPSSTRFSPAANTDQPLSEVYKKPPPPPRSQSSSFSPGAMSLEMKDKPAAARPNQRLENSAPKDNPHRPPSSVAPTMYLKRKNEPAKEVYDPSKSAPSSVSDASPKPNKASQGPIKVNYKEPKANFDRVPDELAPMRYDPSETHHAGRNPRSSVAWRMKQVQQLQYKDPQPRPELYNAGGPAQPQEPNRRDMSFNYAAQEDFYERGSAYSSVFQQGREQLQDQGPYAFNNDGQQFYFDSQEQQGQSSSNAGYDFSQDVYGYGNGQGGYDQYQQGQQPGQSQFGNSYADSAQQEGYDYFGYDDTNQQPQYDQQQAYGSQDDQESYDSQTGGGAGFGQPPGNGKPKWGPSSSNTNSSGNSGATGGFNWTPGQ